ncbi:MAG: hypothetical protein FWF29_02465 [Treponema sp.]|nr:hypothetical protein [Treponema sp.]
MDALVIPPETFPLSRQAIGYGVVNVSYIQLLKDAAAGVSLGYLRRGDVVCVLERRVINTGNKTEDWVLADGIHRGWIRETGIDMYDNELQARTASEAMAK